MDSVDTEVLKTAVAWLADGRKSTLATVIKTWGSAPRPIGAMLVIRDDGHVVGSVSGGCVEDDLIERVKGLPLQSAKPQLVTYGVTADQAARFGLPCGGTLQLVLEPVRAESQLEELLATIERHELVARFLDVETGEVTLKPGRWSDVLEYDGKMLKSIHGPRWRLLIIGAGQTSRFLAQMAQALDYQVTVCDPRDEYADEWSVPGVILLRGYPDDVVLQMNPDPHLAVVAVTHDPKLDDAALTEALKSPAFYVGALGSRLNNERRRKRLAEFELLFVDFQGLDPGLEGRWWNSKLSRRPGRSGNPASRLSQRRLDNLPLASRLNTQSRRRFSPRCLRRSPFGKPQLIN